MCRKWYLNGETLKQTPISDGQVLYRLSENWTLSRLETTFIRLYKSTYTNDKAEEWTNGIEQLN